jgi:hypothetical protein
MRRLLPAIVALGLCLALAASAFASGRVPNGVKRINVTLTFPLAVKGSKPAVHRTLTRAATVQKVVGAADALRTAKVIGVCPMFVRLADELTVVFKGSSGQTLAETRVQVEQGSRGTSGSSPCFPVQFVAGNQNLRLVGNGYVRLLGRLIGTAIS